MDFLDQREMLFKSLRRRLLVLTLAIGAANAASARDFGSFDWTDATGASDPDRSLTVYYSAPDKIRADTPVWLAIHGMSRNADDYCRYLAAPKAARRALVIAPEFSKADWPKSNGYNVGNLSVSESNREPRPRSEWSFSKIEPLFDHVRQRFAPGLEADTYSLFGHSAGGQFVHRYLMWTPEARVKRAIAANAGWYTLPLRRTAAEPSEGAAYPYEWPYTLKGAPDYTPQTPAYDAVPGANLSAAFARDVVVLLGDADTLRTDNLRQTKKADAQGPHRLARGRYFFHTARQEAERLDSPFNWRVEIVPDVGHSGRRMAAAAAELLRAADAESRRPL